MPKMSEVLKRSDFSKVKKIVSFIEESGKITPKEAEEISGKSTATVRRYLKMLVQTGYIEAEGNTNNTIYRICVLSVKLNVASSVRLFRADIAL